MLHRTLLALSLLVPVFAGMPPGRPLPDVPISQPGGKKLDLKQYRGKALVLALISTDCEHCDHAVDFLKIMQKESAAQGLQVVAAAGDPDAAKAIAPFGAQHQPNFPIGYLDKAAFLRLANLKPDDRPFVPVILFIDAKGMVRVQLAGDDPLMDKMETVIRGTIRELLKEPGITKNGKP
ncbi:MAG: TlpA family protein disulfide reductase [Bryobacterales bacterium]|nr:TlpA family protein disulfide reductase [Bryobacterales bacterium]